MWLNPHRVDRVAGYLVSCLWVEIKFPIFATRPPGHFYEQTQPLISESTPNVA